MIHVVCAADIGSAMGSLAAIVLILIFLGKLINIFKAGLFYDTMYIFIGWVAAIICFFFVLIGLLTEPSVLMGSYLMFSSALFGVTTILFIIELLLSFAKVDFRGRIETSFTRK